MAPSRGDRRRRQQARQQRRQKRQRQADRHESNPAGESNFDSTPVLRRSNHYLAPDPSSSDRANPDSDETYERLRNLLNHDADQSTLDYARSPLIVDPGLAARVRWAQREAADVDWLLDAALTRAAIRQDEIRQIGDRTADLMRQLDRIRIARVATIDTERGLTLGRRLVRGFGRSIIQTIGMAWLIRDYPDPDSQRLAAASRLARGLGRYLAVFQNREPYYVRVRDSSLTAARSRAREGAKALTRLLAGIQLPPG
jgi:hypothetical protein